MNNTEKNKLYNERYEAAKNHYLTTKDSAKTTSKLFKTDPLRFLQRLNDDDITTIRKCFKDITVFKNIDTEEKAYWLGFLYADGYVCYEPHNSQYRLELTLAEKDLEHLKKFAKFINYDKQIKYRKKVKAYRLDVASKEMCENLIKLGCVQAKSLILKYPDYEILKYKFHNAFIRGYFDGDGCLSLSSTSNTFSTSLLGTKHMMQGIINHMKLSNYRWRNDKQHHENTITLSLRVQEALKFLKTIYSDSNIHLSRKYDKYYNDILPFRKEIS
jgi:hypothetical protein